MRRRQLSEFVHDRGQGKGTVVERIDHSKKVVGDPLLMNVGSQLGSAEVSPVQALSRAERERNDCGLLSFQGCYSSRPCVPGPAWLVVPSLDSDWLLFPGPSVLILIDRDIRRSFLQT